MASETPDPDERFSIEGDPEDALRAALGASPLETPDPEAEAEVKAAIVKLEKDWRAAARTQDEAKKAWDRTVRQMKQSGLDVAAEPAVRIARANLDKAIQDWAEALDALMAAIRSR